MHGATSAALRDQLLRAAISVPTNIVEGCAHASPPEFARYAQYSLASVSELEGHVQLARDLELMSEHDFTALLTNIVDARMMLHGLLKTLRKKRQRTTGHGPRTTGTANRARATERGPKESPGS
jgi:four helix bundle protein